MIPATTGLLNSEIQIVESPTIQHTMIPAQKDTEEDRIIGRCDDVSALKQTIFRILNTERYAYEIYSWDFGVEFLDLIGEPVSYVCPEIERRIREALVTDDRITGVDSFEFDTSKRGVVSCTFVVHSKYGDITEERAVNI